MNTRALAAGVLLKVTQGQSLGQCLPAAESDIDFDDRPFLRELCYGSCRWYFRLNALVKMLLDKPLREQDQDIHALLITGLYQLHILETPPHAAIHETVEAARSMGKDRLTGLVNACMRRFSRESEDLLKSLNNNPVTLYSHPKWLVKMLQKAWPEQWENILDANNEHPPFCIRVNQKHHSRSEYLQILKDSGFEAKAGQYAENSIYLDRAVNVGELPGFDQGWCSIQDEAAQLSAELLDCGDSERILDACAAPGGKTGHILESADQLDVTALELEASRMTRIEENLDRLGMSALTINVDAADTDSWWDGKQYDRILVDAPCAAIGVIRRHPDIRLLRRREDIEQLAGVQLHLLNALWALLKPGGRLVYATCSIMPEENAGVVQQFIDVQQDAQVYSLQNMPWGTDSGAGRQLFPQPGSGLAGGHDGFYYAVIDKKLGSA